MKIQGFARLSDRSAWFLIFSFFAILWQERKQAEEDPIPTQSLPQKKKRRETKQKKIFQDLFFHCDDWTRKGVPECLSIPLSSPRVARLVSCMHVNSDGGQRRDWKLRKLTQWIKNINRLRMKVRSHLEKEAKHLLKPEEREELARKVYEIRSVN